MSSSRPANTRRVWSLRIRLLVGQVVVLAVVCIGITAATELALLHHLVAQLDGQLGGTSYRSALMYPEPKHPGWRHESRFHPGRAPVRGSSTRRASPQAWWPRWSTTATP